MEFPLEEEEAGWEKTGDWCRTDTVIVLPLSFLVALVLRKLPWANRIL